MQPEPAPSPKRLWLMKVKKRKSGLLGEEMVAHANSTATSGVYQILMEDNDELETKAASKCNSESALLQTPMIDLTS